MNRVVEGLLVVVFLLQVRGEECANCHIARGYFSETPIEADKAKGPQSKFGGKNYAAHIEPTFDSRTKWPECGLLIHDLGRCGGAEMFQVEVASLSYRYCIKGKPVNLSVQDIISCDRYNFACSGGYIDRSWEHLEVIGVVSEQCFPFISNKELVPYCPLAEECPGGKDIPWERFKCKNGTVRRFTEDRKIRREIQENGPMMAMFEVRGDILNHTERIYMCSQGEKLQLFLLLLGWGEDSKSKYWIARASGAYKFGVDGIIKLRMGVYCPKLAHALTCDPDINS